MVCFTWIVQFDNRETYVHNDTLIADTAYNTVDMKCTDIHCSVTVQVKIFKSTKYD